MFHIFWYLKDLFFRVDGGTIWQVNVILAMKEVGNKRDRITTNWTAVKNLQKPIVSIEWINNERRWKVLRGGGGLQQPKILKTYF